jgi:hypothetical protein
MTNDAASPNTEANVPPESIEEPDEELSIVDKIVGVFVSPVATFKYLYRHPDFWTPFIFVSLITIGLTMMTMPKMAPVTIAGAVEGIQNQAQMSDAEKETAIGITKKIIGISMYGGAIIGTPIALAVGWIITAALIFFITMFQGLNADFKRLLGMIPWTGCISMLTAGLDTVGKMTREFTSMEQLQDLRYVRPYSLLGLIPSSVPLPKFVEGIFSAIDPFFIWGIIVLGIVVWQAAKCTKQQAIITTVIYFIFSLLATGGLMMLSTLAQKQGG